jgi:8-oxo-dGTP diphosphatase
LTTTGKRALVHVVAGVLTDTSGRVLLAQRPAGKHLAGGWEFPGGKLEPGENRFEGLKRELLEELGVILDTATPLIRLHHSYPDRDIDLDVWLVTEFLGEPAGRESQSLRWCPRDELRQAGLLPADMPVIEALLAGAY